MNLEERKIPVVKVIYKDVSPCIYSSQEWEQLGGWKGFLKHTQTPIHYIEKIEKAFMSEYEFATLPEWNP